VVELLARCPQDSEELPAWREDLLALGACIDALGLWQPLLSRHGGVLRLAAEGVAQRLPWAYLHELLAAQEPVFPIYAWLFLMRTPLDAPIHIRRIGMSQRTASSDGLDTLLQLPAPPAAFGLAPPDIGDRLSLGALLLAFVGAPRELLPRPDRSTQDQRALLDLVIFAAAVVAQTADRHVGLGGFLDGPSTAQQDETLDAIGHRGLLWLAEQLPATGFARALEDEIPRAAQIRYVPKAMPSTPSTGFEGETGAPS
ncbi:hypothetical protein, partial [Pelomonas sp. KK5]|uniref:hypothetical protein n=1 Tax=Pelomonas sp. KK5 TaxID=1855730 RepID=UPI001301E7E3